jgi:hypothetical protein
VGRAYILRGSLFMLIHFINEWEITDKNLPESPFYARLPAWPEWEVEEQESLYAHFAAGKDRDR